MNLLTLQQFDYEFSCKSLSDLQIKNKWGLFMHCLDSKDTDSYWMSWMELKTLHDNVEKLYARLHREVKNKLMEEIDPTVEELRFKYKLSE